MKNPLEAAAALWRTFGSEGIRRRASFEVRKRVSALRSDGSTVPQDVLECTLPGNWPFRPNAHRVTSDTRRSEALIRADRVLAGEYQPYRAVWRALPAAPDEWNVDLVTNHRYEAHAPWFRIPHFVSGSDIKDAWEPGRFAWAYDLARGWMLTRNDSYAQAFWTAFESFHAGCRPFRGVQWACGQEVAIRAIALLWSESTFAGAPSSTLARQASLREMLYWSGQRIADAMDYALSQRNNHGISECAGLMAIGARFRVIDADAERWWEEARRALERQILDQFAADGWYGQHSFTYLRLALDQLVHAERLSRAAGSGLGSGAAERVRNAVRLLGTLIDEDTGDVPNHGANDGAFVLPLTTREFRDFRPSLTAAAVTFHVPLPAGVDADSETLAWLDTDPPQTADQSRRRTIVGQSGWIDARVGNVRVFGRAGVYHSRPSHIDALHLDVWLDGKPVAADPGTYRYVGPWSRELSQERAHNTIAIEGIPMAERGPRFLWLRWPRAVITSFREDDDSVIIELLNESWQRAGIEHRRICQLAHDTVTVLDELLLPPRDAARVALHWLIDGVEEDARVMASVPADLQVERAEKDSPYGWISDSYAVRRPATSLTLRTRDSSTRVRFASGFGAARSDAHLRSVLADGIGAACEVVTLSRRGAS